MALLSILMPVKDEALFLTECLASVRPEPGLGLQIVIVDDHSADDTYKIAQKIAAERNDVEIEVLSNIGHGKASALNLAFSRARGESFIFLAGDDLVVSESLRKRVSAVSSDSPKVAQCRYRSFSDNPAYDGTLFPRRGRRDHLAGGATSFNHSFAELYFPIPAQLPNEDTWLRAITLLFDVPIESINAVGLHYRIHEGNSLAPSLTFGEITARLERRHAAFGLALKHFPTGGTPSGRNRLKSLAKAEGYRANGRCSRLLVTRGLPRSDRIVFLANASPVLYRFKQIMLRLACCRFRGH